MGETEYHCAIISPEAWRISEHKLLNRAYGTSTASLPPIRVANISYKITDGCFIEISSQLNFRLIEKFSYLVVR